MIRYWPGDGREVPAYQWRDPARAWPKVRCMKARRNSTVACGHHVLVGQLIVQRADKRWQCLDCAIAAIRNRRRAEPAPPGPARDDTGAPGSSRQPQAQQRAD